MLVFLFFTAWRMALRSVGFIAAPKDKSSINIDGDDKKDELNKMEREESLTFQIGWNQLDLEQVLLSEELGQWRSKTKRPSYGLLLDV